MILGLVLHSLQIPAPSVTVCPQNKFRRDILDVPTVLERANTGDYKNYNNLDIHKDMVSQMCRYLRTSNESKIINYNIYNWLKSVQRNLNETIVHCDSSLNVEMPCDFMFREIYTEAGLCYNFNGLMPEDLYREQV